VLEMYTANSRGTPQISKASMMGNRGRGVSGSSVRLLRPVRMMGELATRLECRFRCARGRAKTNCARKMER
jgi:hypothetical protein